MRTGARLYPVAPERVSNLKPSKRGGAEGRGRVAHSNECIEMENGVCRRRFIELRVKRKYAALWMRNIIVKNDFLNRFAYMARPWMLRANQLEPGGAVADTSILIHN